MFVALALLTGGCGGLNATQTVSPATFFLPGIMKASPAGMTNAPVAVLGDSNEIASAK
jgi:hypothetical protein